jgi:hypothetical protein
MLIAPAARSANGPQDELTISRDSSEAFERVRAEMIKLGTLVEEAEIVTEPAIQL